MNEGGEGNCQINLEEEPPSPGDKNLPVPTNSLTTDTSDATSSLVVLPSPPAALLEISNEPPVKIRGFGAIIASGLTKTLLFIVLSPLIGFVLGFGIMVAIVASGPGVPFHFRR